MGLLQNELLRIIAVNSFAWFLVIFIPGVTIQKLPLRLFREDWFLFRIRSWERGGRIYRKIGVHRWKEFLPDGAGIFAGGFRKKRLGRPDKRYMREFVLETCRAELVHWIIIAMIPLFFLWNPPEVAIWMIPIGLLANVPCLLTQRFNRPRLMRLL